jgi:hypothetical protein
LADLAELDMKVSNLQHNVDKRKSGSDLRGWHVISTLVHKTKVVILRN